MSEELKIIVTMVDQVSGTAKNIKGGLSGLGDLASGALKVGLGVALGGATALAGGLFVATKAAAEAEDVQADLAATLLSTKGASGMTLDSLNALATGFQNTTKFEDDTILKGQSMLLTFCLEESAQALTKERGWVSHDGLNSGDEILAYDPEDDTIRWEPVESVHVFDVKRNLIRWNSRQIDVATTPNHKWWTRKHNKGGYGPPQFSTTEEISGHQNVQVKIGGGQPACFLDKPIYSDDIVELAGWVITEGWYQKKCPNGVGFCQSLTANPSKVEKIRDLVSRLQEWGHKISEVQQVMHYNNSAMLQWHFAHELGAEIRFILPNKKLTPDFISHLTKKQARLLLDTLIMGDGYTDSSGARQYIQKDNGQLDMVAALSAMLGIRTSRLGRGDSLYLCSTNHAWGHQVNAREEYYDGKVWCPHLRTGIFLARCNGRTFWTGNTNIGKDVFPLATEAMLNMGQKFGSVDTASIQLGKALNDPIAGVGALRKVGVQLTDQQEAQIKTYMALGDIEGAQKIILGELQTEFGGLAVAAGQTASGRLEIFKNKLGDIEEKIGGAMLPGLTRLGDGLIKALDNPIVVKAIDTITNWLAEALPKAIDAGAGLLNNLSKNGLSGVLTQAAIWVQDPKTQAMLQSAGKSAGEGIVAGVKFAITNGPAWTKAAQDMGKVLAPILANAALSVGYGFWAGVIESITGFKAKEMPALFKVPGFASGGTVPGAIGSPQLIVAHGGEIVNPIGGGGNFTFVYAPVVSLADEREAKSRLTPILNQWWTDAKRMRTA